MLALALGGFICQWIYKNSPQRAINVTEVSRAVRAMQRNADAKIDVIGNLLKDDRVDSLTWISFEKLQFTYLVYENDKLIFWSDNQTEPENLKNTSWKFDKLSNILALTKSKKIDNYNIVAYIPLKNNYPYENKELQNSFYRCFAPSQ